MINQTGGDGYTLDVNKANINNLPEVTKINTDCSSAPIAEPVNFNNTLEVQTANQVGAGANENPYKYMYDVISGQKVLTKSLEGKNMLKNYVKMYNLLNN